MLTTKEFYLAVERAVRPGNPDAPGEASKSEVQDELIAEDSDDNATTNSGSSRLQILGKHSLGQFW